ncbi:MAG TPA: GtrA family protein [Ktedonobacteraceae bacterium]|jgi:putative flippase GtrA|nr:GtrA family protein [Ktedonobacteraceae bacterium]
MQKREQPSYNPTPWLFVNRMLDIVDLVSGGRADWVIRFLSYCVIGGFAAVVNLVVFHVVFYNVPLPFDSQDAILHNIVASAVAAEISILANFIPNDFFTFRHLPGRARSWPARCLRFHATSISGSVLTFLIEFGFSYLLHIQPTIAQALALIIVLFYNFTVHHLFTYRHVATTEAKE